MYRVILADDHVLVRQGLKRILAETGDLQVAGEACDGLELLDVLAKSAADMVVLDISMPRLPGHRGHSRDQGTLPGRCHPHPHHMYKDMEYLYLALSSGAKGYVLKDDAEKRNCLMRWPEVSPGQNLRVSALLGGVGRRFCAPKKGGGKTKLRHRSVEPKGKADCKTDSRGAFQQGDRGVSFYQREDR